MTDNKKIKFAVLGAGHIGKRHAEMVRRDEESELLALIDVRSQSDCGADHFDVPFFSSLDEFLAAGIEADVVNVCTPNGLHAAQSMQILDAGMHVVCEKPMGLSKDNCEKVIYESLKQSKHVFCVMQNRYSPPSEWLKELVDNKRLGDIYMVQLNCYWNRDNRYYKADGWKGKQDLDGGTLFTQFSHFIDIMYWLFGDIQNIQGKFADFNHSDTTDFEDSGFVSFEFVDGGMGCVNYSTAVANQNLESSITIIGENGSVKVGGQYMNEVEKCDIAGYTMPDLPPSNPANDYGHYKGSAANHGYIFDNIHAALSGAGEITTNALEGLKVVDIIERMYAAGKRPLKQD